MPSHLLEELFAGEVLGPMILEAVHDRKPPFGTFLAISARDEISAPQGVFAPRLGPALIVSVPFTQATLEIVRAGPCTWSGSGINMGW